VLDSLLSLFLAFFSGGGGGSQLTAQAAALRKEHAHVGKCLHGAQHNAGDGHGWGDDDACEFDWGCSLRDFMVAKVGA
jgi:hypothetical protein